MSQIFEDRVNAEAVDVIDDMLSLLKLNRRRPDATGARVAAIGLIQDKLEAERCAIMWRSETIISSQQNEGVAL